MVSQGWFMCGMFFAIATTDAIAFAVVFAFAFLVVISRLRLGMTTRRARAKTTAKTRPSQPHNSTAIYCPVRPMRKNIAKTDTNGHPLDLGEGRRVRSTTVI